MTNVDLHILLGSSMHKVHAYVPIAMVKVGASKQKINKLIIYFAISRSVPFNTGIGPVGVTEGLGTSP